MSNRSFVSKLILSAFCGLLIVGLLVIYPGMFFAFGRSDSRLSHLHSQLGPQLSSDLQAVITGGESHGLTFSNTHELRRQMLWLLFAQHEIDCLPFLFFCSCIGPTIIILTRKQKSQQSSNKTTGAWIKCTKLVFLYLFLPFYLLSFLVFVSALLGESM